MEKRKKKCINRKEDKLYYYSKFSFYSFSCFFFSFLGLFSYVNQEHPQEESYKVSNFFVLVVCNTADTIFCNQRRSQLKRENWQLEKHKGEERGERGHQSYERFGSKTYKWKEKEPSFWNFEEVVWREEFVGLLSKLKQINLKLVFLVAWLLVHLSLSTWGERCTTITLEAN